MPIPFQNSYYSIPIEEEQTESNFISHGSLNFTYDINNELLSDVFVQGNPQTCKNYTFSPFRNLFGKSKLQNGEQKNKSTDYMDYDFFMKNPETKSHQFWIRISWKWVKLSMLSNLHTCLLEH